MLAVLTISSCSQEGNQPLKMPHQVLLDLQAFQAKSKFANAAWEARGLRPSDSELSARLNRWFNNCAAQLITHVQQGAHKPQLKQTLVAGLNALARSDYDTEEREFVVDYFRELAQLVEVDVNDELTTWQYGQLAHALLNGVGRSKTEKAAPALTQACTKCKAALETFLLEQQPAIPSACFLVAQCEVCTELNLIEVPNGVKRMNFGKYTALQSLDRKEYTPEQAEAKLAQLKRSRE